MMNLERWDAWCRRVGTRPVATRETKHGTVYIAEGIRPAIPTSNREAERESHFYMVWALSRDGLDIAKDMAVGAVHYPLTSQRIEIVMRDVAEWVEDNLDSGRYAA